MENPMAEAAKKEEPARLMPPITTDRVRQAEHSRVTYEVVVPAGTEPQDVLAVAYWAHLGTRFKAAKDLGSTVDLIVVVEDLKWEAEMRVVDAGSNWAKVVFKTVDKDGCRVTQLGGIQAQRVVFLPGH